MLKSELIILSIINGNNFGRSLEFPKNTTFGSNSPTLSTKKRVLKNLILSHFFQWFSEFVFDYVKATNYVIGIFFHVTHSFSVYTLSLSTTQWYFILRNCLQCTCCSLQVNIWLDTYFRRDCVYVRNNFVKQFKNVIFISFYNYFTSLYSIRKQSSIKNVKQYLLLRCLMKT